MRSNLNQTAVKFLIKTTALNVWCGINVFGSGVFGANIIYVGYFETGGFLTVFFLEPLLKNIIVLSEQSGQYFLRIA